MWQKLQLFPVVKRREEPAAVGTRSTRRTKSGGLIIKALLVSLFTCFRECLKVCCRWLRLQGPAKEMFQFVSLQTRFGHNASPYELKPNIRQQLLVKRLEDFRSAAASEMKLCKMSVGFSASVFILEKTEEKL